MSYILIAIVAYVMQAFNGVADKFLLSHVNRHASVYVFYSAVISPLVLVFAPFGLHMLPARDFFIAIMAGVSFGMALYFFYTAIRETSVSRILPIQGGMVPTFTLVLAYFLIDERLATIQYLAFLLLVAGAVLMSLKHDDTGWHPRALKTAITAALLFSLSFVLTKHTYEVSNFVTGLIWTRMGIFFTGLAFLTSAYYRRNIFTAPKDANKRNLILYYGAKINGRVAGFLQNYAISIGSVTIVNALQGVQFAVLLGATIILSTYYPKILKEKINTPILVQKIIAIVLISIGLIMP